MTYRNKKILFYVVQFTEKPFEGIDYHVCVPYSWLIKQTSSSRSAAVTYPNDEDSIDTRDRVKRLERPNDDWRFYTALIKFQSEDYKDADFWIAKKHDYGPDEGKSNLKDAQAASVPNKTLRSASQTLWSDSNSDMPQLPVKPYRNLRKPLPRISIRRPLSQSPGKNLDNKRLKLVPGAKSGSDTDQAIASGRSKRKQPTIISDNQLIQNDQTKTSFASNSEMNSDQSTQPGDIENNQSVYISVQSSSKKLLAQLQPSPKLSDKQQLPPQPSTNQQPSLKLTDGQDFSPKLPAKHKLSPVHQEYQQPLSMTVIHPVECKENIESCENVLLEPVTGKKPLTKTLPSTLEQNHQAELIDARSTLLVRPEHSHPEPQPRGVSVRQSKEPDDRQKTYLDQILTAPKIVPRTPSPLLANQPIQQHAHIQVPTLPVSSILNSNPKPQEMDERNSIKAFHNYQRPRSEDSMQCTLSPFHLKPKQKKLSQPSTSSAKKQIPVVKKLRNPVDKKTRLESITKNITTMQYPPNSTMQLTSPGGSAFMQTESLAQNPLQQARVISSLLNNVRGDMREECVDQIDPLSEGIMNTSAAQNLSKLAHQYSSFVEASRKQYSSTQEDYLQQLAQMQDMLRTPSMARTIDQRVHHQNRIINTGFSIQSQPNPIYQPIQFLPPNYNQCIPFNGAYAQGVISHGLMRGSIDGAHTTYKPIVQNGVNIQLTANNSSHQSYQNSERPQQEQSQLNYQDPGTSSTHNGFSLQSKRSSHILGSQGVIKKPRSPFTLKTPAKALSDAQKSYLCQEINSQSRVNQSYTEYNNINLADVRGNFTVDPVPTQDSMVQTMLSSNQIHKTQSTVPQSHNVYQQTHTNKTMVDRSTEMDSIVDVDNCVDKLTRSLEIIPRVVDSACQTDGWLREQIVSLSEETASDSTNDTESEIESEIVVMSEANQTTLTNEQNLTPDNQEILSRIDIEQEMLNIFGTLFTQMGAHLSYTCDMFHNLRKSILVCNQTYEQLLEVVEKLNSIETLQIPTSSSNNVPSQVAQERPEVDDDNNTGVGDASTPIREQKGTFSLPKEYDPNDTKWTLKYQKYKPGLLELIPRTGVYVSRKNLKRCIQESADCRTLARLLLTEVFSMKALSVCSLTGARATVFKSLNIDVRPGLDEHARLVLLGFVEEHGNKQGWITTDTSAVMSSIRSKINDIRGKHDKTCEV